MHPGQPPRGYGSAHSYATHRGPPEPTPNDPRNPVQRSSQQPSYQSQPIPYKGYKGGTTPIHSHWDVNGSPISSIPTQPAARQYTTYPAGGRGPRPPAAGPVAPSLDALRALKRSAADLMEQGEEPPLKRPAHPAAQAMASFSPQLPARAPAPSLSSAPCDTCDHMHRVLHAFHGLVNSEADFWLLLQPPPPTANQSETMASLTHWCFHLIAQFCFFRASAKSSHRIPGNTVQRALMHELAECFGLRHASAGTGADRVVELSKRGGPVPRLSAMQLQGALQHALRNVNNQVSRGEERERFAQHREREMKKAKGELVPRPTEHKGTQCDAAACAAPEGPVVQRLAEALRARAGALDVAALQGIQAAVAAAMGKPRFEGLGLGSLLDVVARHSTLATAFNQRLCGCPPTPWEEVQECVGQCVQAQGDGQALGDPQLAKVLRAQFGAHAVAHGPVGAEHRRDPPANVYCGAALVVEAGAEGGADVTLQEGSLGDVDKHLALRCLRHCPCLVDLSASTQWPAVFQPSLGPLHDFLRCHAAAAGIHVVQTRDSFLRVDPEHGSLGGEPFVQAVAALDAPEVTHAIVASIVGSGGVQLAPLALLGSQLHTGLVRAAPDPDTATRFVLDCLTLLPGGFRCPSVADLVLLQPLHRVVPDCPASLLRLCLPPLRGVLYQLGFQLGVPAWTEACREELHSDAPSLVRPLALHRHVAGGGPQQPNTADGRTAVANHVGGCQNVQVVRSSKTTIPSEEVDSACQHPSISPSEQNPATQLVGDGSAAFEVVEAIRRQEFGIGLGDIGPAVAAVLAQQHQRVGRALQRLAAELYTDDSHFVLELIQNADDNEYPEGVVEPTLHFALLDDCLVVRNNERGFQPAHVRAICDVGSSTKDPRKRAGCIGQKGIGFKSVFRVTDTPMIHSNGFRLRFDCRSQPVRFIVPEWVEDWPTHTLDPSWTTHIVLPFKAGDAAAQHAELAAQLGALQPTLLLFLRRLRRLTVTSPASAVHRDVYVASHPTEPDAVTLHAGGEAQDWLLVRRQVTSPVARDAAASSPGAVTEVTLAFPISHASTPTPLPPQNLFAFLPLRSYGLRFVVQADFVVPSNREDLDQSSPWNQWLRSELAPAFLQAVERFKQHSHLKYHYYEYLPLEGELLSFLRPLAGAIRHLLQQTACLLTAGEDWAPPAQVVTAPEGVRQVVPEDLLQATLGLRYLHPKVACAPAVLARLGAGPFAAGHLVDVVEALVRRRQLASRGLAWLAAAFLCLHRLLAAGGAEANARLVARWAALPVVPTASGTHVAPAHRPVFLLQDGQPAAGVGPADAAVHRFLGLELLAPDFGRGLDALEQGVLEGFLLHIGVHRLSVLEVVESHLTAWLAAPDGPDVPSCLDAALRYLQCHWGTLRDRPSLVGRLRATLRIRTNRGHVPVDSGVHYSAAFGNPVGDLLALLPAFPLPVMDDSLLAGETDVRQWRAMLDTLGVADFLPLVRRTVAVARQADSEWASEAPWPPSSPEGYDVDDTLCPGFLPLTAALAAGPNAVASFRTLARLIGSQWDTRFAAAARAALHPKGPASPHHVAAPSSFALQLRRTPWLPAQRGGVAVPGDLFAPSPENRAAFGPLVDYTDPELGEFGEGFLAGIGVVLRPTVDAALRCLARATVTAVGHVTPLYLFLEAALSSAAPQILEAFAARPLVFIPDHGMCSLAAVVWEDPADTPAVRPPVFHPLAPHYPPLLEPLFSGLGVRRHPSAAQYVRCLEALAAAEQPGHREAAGRVLEHWSAALQRPGGPAPPDAAPTAELLRGKAVFPTDASDRRWCALDSPRFFVDDAPHLSPPFRRCAPPFAFLDLRCSSVPRLSPLLHALHFPLLSCAVAAEARAAEAQLHPPALQLLGELLPFLQRYVLQHHPAAYREAVEAGLPQRLKQHFRVYRCAALEVVYRLAGVASPPGPAVCALAGDALYLLADHPFPQLLPKLCYEFTRLFLRGAGHGALVSFAQVLAATAPGDREEYAADTQHVGPLPAGEAPWGLVSVAIAQDNPPMPAPVCGPADNQPAVAADERGMVGADLGQNASASVPLMEPPEAKPSKGVGLEATDFGDSLGPQDSGPSVPGADVVRSPRDGDDRRAVHAAASEVLQALLPELGRCLCGVVRAVDVLDVQCLPGGRDGRLFVVLVRLQLAPADGGTRTQAAQLQAAQHPDGSTALRALKRLTDAELAEHLAAAAAGRGGARTSPREMSAPGSSVLNVVKRGPARPVIPTELRVSLNELSEEARQAVGRWGEEAVYRHLTQQYSAGRVQWVNFPTESGKPYDITVEINGELHFIEVKSSKATDKQFFEVSHNEWMTAWREGPRYHVYRVFGTGQGTVTVVDLQDPWHCWERGELRVCLVI